MRPRAWLFRWGLLAAALATAPAPASSQGDTARDALARFFSAFPARNLGPAAFSGRVTALAVAGAPTPAPKTIYVGAAGGGLWKTTNGGMTWQSVSTGLGVQTIGDVAVAPSDPQVVWAGTGERNSLRSQWWGDGVYRSADGGKTWTNMGLGATRSIGRIVIHPRNPDIVYVAALGHLWGPNPDRGVYQTTDGGTTWRKVLFVDDTTGFVDLVMDPKNSAVLYAAAWHRLRWGGSHMEGVGAGSGIFKTTDGGATWTKLTDPKLSNGLPTENMGRIGLDVSPQDSRVVYAIIQVERGITDPLQGRYGGVFRSNDAGASWTHANDLQAVPHYYYDEIRVDPTNAERVFVAASPLLESKDGGRTFAPDSLPRVHVDNHALWINPADPAELLLGNDGGVYVTRDSGRAWEHMAIPIGQFYSAIVDSSVVPYQVCGGLQDNGVWCGPSRTRDTVGITDADWYPVNGGDGMWVQIPPRDPYTIYSGWQFGHLSRLDLRTWKREDITPLVLDAGRDSGYPFNWGWTTPLLLSTHDPTVLYVGANRLIRMTHGGDDWDVLGPDMTRADREHPTPEVGHTSYHAIFSIAESPESASVLWTGSDDGLLWLTRDGGRTWANLASTLPPDAPKTCVVASIAASARAVGGAWVVLDCHTFDDYHPYIYRTEDFGRSWTARVTGLPADGGSLAMVEDRANPRVAWLGTAEGLYATVDEGERWRRFGKDLPPAPVEAVALSYQTRELVLATHGRGLWVVPVGPLEEASDSVFTQPVHLFGVPVAYQYRRSDTYPDFGTRPFVAPNPAKGAVISYYLRDAQAEAVKLVITTAAGDTVKQFTGPGYAGLQWVTWDLSRDRPRPREKGGPTDPADLKQVLAGTYVVHLRIGAAVFDRPVTVVDWPSDRLGRVR